MGVFIFLRCNPLTMHFSFKWWYKRKIQPIEQREIFPAEIKFMGSYQEFHEYTEGGGQYEYFYDINYILFTENNDIRGTFRFTTSRGLSFSRKQKMELYNHYRGKKYIFMLFDPKTNKDYPVRLYKKE